ncbi:ras-related protein RIC1-like isoform X1 [Pecten maximus]|uniref:ras-related protein RIC1-like isoform X1 n=1 Tax=Pecten maximus TaxID=6579 RepID=UPI001458E3E9|nr:ras-related protein RIC1-like isoform X1 [Pecten maximus]
MSFPIPYLVPLDFVVDRWNFGHDMALCFHSLLNDIIEETHDSSGLSYLPSDDTKSQRQNNIDFSQALSTKGIAKTSLSTDFTTRQHKHGAICYRQWNETEFIKYRSPSNGRYITNTLTTDTTQMQLKRGVPKDQCVDLKVKVIFLGENGVGKTTMFETFESENLETKTVKKTHSHHIRKSSKAEFPRKTSYKSVVKRGKGNVDMTICDTAGQERYRSLTSSYYRGTHGCLILFDVTKGHTFESVQSWYSDLEAYCTSPEMISTILVGNNCDSEEREIPKEKAEKLAEHIGIPYMEVYSDNSHTVSDVFEALADMIIDKYRLHPSLDTVSTSTRLPKPSNKPSTWCFC